MEAPTSSAASLYAAYIARPTDPNWRALVDAVPLIGKQHEHVRTGTLVRTQEHPNCVYRIVSPARHQLRDGRRFFSVRIARFNRAANRWNSSAHAVEVAL